MIEIIYIYKHQQVAHPVNKNVYSFLSVETFIKVITYWDSKKHFINYQIWA